MNSTDGCPICGSGISRGVGESIEDLEAHLAAHTKQDLIHSLLRQRQNFGGVTTKSSSRKSPDSVESEPNSTSITSTSPDSESAIVQYDYDASLSQDAISQDSISCSAAYTFQQLPHHSRSLANLQPLTSESPKTNNNHNNNTPAQLDGFPVELPLPYGLVQLGTFSVPFHFNLHNDTHSESDVISGSCASTAVCDLISTTTHEMTSRINADVAEGEGSCEEIILGSTYPENSLTVSSDQSDQDTQRKELVQEESDNATSQTSIIKYIIDQSAKTCDELPEQNLILPDGRTIPVYSSFTQMHVVNKDERQQLHHENPKIIVGDEIGMNLITDGITGTTISLNLMTDEEIPPRGEISEFEESNTSSLVSEDAKTLVKRNLRNSSSPFSKKKPVPRSRQAQNQKNQANRRKATNIEGRHQFLCYECPTVQKFKSLFELIGHKVKLHPSVPEQFSDNTASSSQPLSTPLLSPTIMEYAINNPINPPAAKEFFCVYCNTTFDNKVALARHMETDHGDKPLQPNIFECNTCGKTFQARTNLRKHLLVHKERKHVCQTCFKGFTSNFKLIEHARVHAKVYPFKCEKCEKAYRTQSLLNHHMKTVHVPESERPVKPKIEFYCGVCHKILRSKRSYFCHAKSHLATPKKCPYCCETFSRQSVLVRHIRVTHDPQYESSENKDCPICQKKMHPNSMIKHMRIHANEKNYSCQVCSKKFRTYANLSSHSWSHTNVDKPFKCRICSKSYLFQRTLEHHMMVHKRRTLHFTCNECGVRFTNKVNMKRHLDEHYSEKKFKCTTCGKSFQRNYYLLEHERIHTGLKPFLCNICGKASTTKSNHRAHLKIHDARDATSQEG